MDDLEDRFEFVAAGEAVAIVAGIGGRRLRPDLVLIPLEGSIRAMSCWRPARATARAWWPPSASAPRPA
ncbi:hypothetical protein GCM10009527_084100 [Actinomadura nitritigenes]|uniref:Uncharacterized protein n=1 Tax=Actinomadura nitritigenes TaxID=134602 RepID=A0ABS3RGJ4_9ACTN|nr:hypothetical protein [Actinomadura nitritigenes]MBO2444714.1 hypothetical protein [Actinomadura nitritigenes]